MNSHLKELVKKANDTYINKNKYSNAVCEVCEEVCITGSSFFCDSFMECKNNKCSSKCGVCCDCLTEQCDDFECIVCSIDNTCGICKKRIYCEHVRNKHDLCTTNISRRLQEILCNDVSNLILNILYTWECDG